MDTINLKEKLIEQVDKNFNGLGRLIEQLEAVYIYELILLTGREIDSVPGIGKGKKQIIYDTLAQQGLTTEVLQKLRLLIKPRYEEILLRNEGTVSPALRHQEMTEFIAGLEL